MSARLALCGKVILLVTAGACSGSPAKKAEKATATLRSWTAAARLTVESWAAGRVTRAYASRTLEIAGQEMETAARSLDEQIAAIVRVSGLEVFRQAVRQVERERLNIQDERSRREEARCEAVKKNGVLYRNELIPEQPGRDWFFHLEVLRGSIKLPTEIALPPERPKRPDSPACLRDHLPQKDWSDADRHEVETFHQALATFEEQEREFWPKRAQTMLPIFEHVKQRGFPTHEEGGFPYAFDVCAWLPAELHYDNDPPHERLLPVPRRALTDAEKIEVGVAGLLHDVGKTQLALDLIRKPGTLSEEEFEEIKKHPEEGFALLGKMSHIRPGSAYMVLEHHMRFDRKGYPKRGPDYRLHANSMLISVSDCYDALTTMLLHDPFSRTRAAIPLASSAVLVRASTARRQQDADGAGCDNSEDHSVRGVRRDQRFGRLGRNVGPWAVSGSPAWFVMLIR